MQQTKVEKHFDTIAKNYDYYKNKNSFYYANLKHLLKDLIPKNKKVLEIGCGTGDLLTYLNPKIGIGYDLSAEMVKLAKIKHKTNKNIVFTHSSLSTVHQSLDFIFMSDVIEHMDNPTKEFENISKLMGPNTKFINTMANPIWEPILMIAEKLGLKMPEGPHNRISNHELKVMIEKAGMKIVKHDYKLLVPVRIPIVTSFANKYLEKYLKKLCFIEYFVAVKA